MSLFFLYKRFCFWFIRLAAEMGSGLGRVGLELPGDGPDKAGQFARHGGHGHLGLIWLSIVKRAIGLLSEMFIFRFASPRTFLSQRQGRHDCGFNAEMRESTPDLHRGVINRSRSEAARISV